MRRLLARLLLLPILPRLFGTIRLFLHGLSVLVFGAVWPDILFFVRVKGAAFLCRLLENQVEESRNAVATGRREVANRTSDIGLLDFGWRRIVQTRQSAGGLQLSDPLKAIQTSFLT